MSRIEGKVASVLNERELVLNIGSDDAVEVGMRFKILYSGGIEITDPDTDEPLGNVEWPKTEVKIVSVQPHMAVGRTFRTITVPPKGQRGLASYAAALSMMGSDYEPEKRVVETLRSSDGFAEKEIDPTESVVKRGDPAVQVIPLPKQSDTDDSY